MAVGLFALGPAQPGCTHIEGSNDGVTDPGAEGDAKGPAGDARPADGDDGGAGDDCPLSGGSDGAGTVRLVYVVPSDRQPDERHIANLEQSLRHVQLWLRDRTPRRTSILLHDPAVEIVESEHPASYYATHAVGDDPNLFYWYNATDDALDAVDGGFGDPDDIWLLYVAADPACGQVTGTSTHVALFPENDLRGLVGDPRVAICPGGEDNYGRCRWVGGMALLLGLALGVPGAAGCSDGDAATPCPNDLLDRLGYTTYPAATLSDDQLEFLADSPFVRGTGLPDCALACDRVVTP